MPGTDFNTEAMLSFVSELDKRVGNLKKELSSLADISGTSMKKAGAETEKFGDTLEKNIKPLKGMRDQSGGITRTLTGLGGIGAAFYSASKAMDQFAISGLQSRNLALDLGLTTKAVGEFKTQLSAAGIDGKTAAQQLGALTSKLDDIKTYGTASAVYKALAANDPILAGRLLQAERAGDRLQSLQWIKEKWAQPGEPRSKLYLGETLGVNPSTMAALQRNQQGLIQPTSYSKDELEEYNIGTTNMMTLTANIWGDAMMFMVRDSNKFIEATKKEFSTASSWFQELSDQFTGKKEGIVFGEKQGLLPSQKEWGELWEGIKKAFSMSAKAEEQPAGTAPPEAVDTFKLPNTNIFREKLDTSRDSYNLLLDIRNMLGDDEHDSGMWSGGGGGPRSSGGTGGSGFQIPSYGTGSGAPTSDGSSPTEGAVQPRGGGRSGYNYFQHRGDAPIRSANQLAIIDTKWGKLRVHPEAANDFKTFYDKLAEANAPVGTSGTYNLRQKRWGGGWSSHSWAAAHDIGNSQFFSPAMKQWILANPDKWREALSSGNLGQPLTDRSMVGGKDPAHVEWRGPRLNPDGTVARQQNNTAARSSIDSSFKPATAQNRGARIDVEVNGAPKGVSTNAELMDQGVFGTLNLRNNPALPR